MAGMCIWLDSDIDILNRSSQDAGSVEAHSLIASAAGTYRAELARMTGRYATWLKPRANPGVEVGVEILQLVPDLPWI